MPAVAAGTKPERRQHRVAPADAGHAEEHPAKVPRSPADLLKRRARIGDGDESAARPSPDAD